MALLEWLFGAAAAFGGLVALMYVAQRSLMYFPERLHTPPAMAGLPEAQEVALDTKDGERVIVWHVPPRTARTDDLFADDRRRHHGGLLVFVGPMPGLPDDQCNRLANIGAAGNGRC